MKSNEVYDYVRKWLINKRINVFYSSKEKGHKRVIRMTEDDLYELCIKLVNLIESNTE